MVNKSRYASIIKSAMKSAKASESGDQTDTIANAIADAIVAALGDAEVMGAQYTVAPGIPTAGSPASQVTVGPGTVVGTAKLS